MQRFEASALTIAIALGALPTAAMAEEAEAPSIVVVGQHDDYQPEETASLKTGTSLHDTPQSVSVISREQIEDQGFEQLNDVLRYVPGVSLAQGEGHRDQISIRGQATTADFFLDGLRDDAQYYRSLYNIERVEVLRGSNALLFGRGGGGGAINRVSKAPRFDGQSMSGAASVDSFAAWSVAGDINQPLGDMLALRFNATHEEFDNHRDFYAGHFTGVAPTLGAKLGEATTLTLAYEYADDSRITDRGVPSFNGSPIRGYEKTFFGDPAINHSSVKAHFARARLDTELAEGLTLDVTGQFTTYDKYYGNILPGAVNTAGTMVALTGYRSTTQRDNWIGQANLVWKGDTGPVKHTLLLGFEAADQDTLAGRDDARFAAATSTSVPLARTISVPASTWAVTSLNHSAVRSLSGYLQDQLEFGEHVQLLLGLRYDDFRITATNRLNNAVTGRSDGKWSPRLGLVLKPMPSISLYASYAKSFLPQAGDQFTTLAANIQTLEPEEFRNLEAGVKWDVTESLAFNAAVFRLDRRNTRANDPVTGNPVLTGSSRVDGFEASLAGRISPQWQATLGYAYQDGEIRTTTTAAPAGQTLDKLPRHQVTAWTRYDVTPELGIGMGVVHQSSQFAAISNAVRLPAFTRVDAAVFYTVSERISLQLNVENLFDAGYFPSAHTDNNIATGKPLAAKLTARVKF